MTEITETTNFGSLEDWKSLYLTAIEVGQEYVERAKTAEARAQRYREALEGILDSEEEVVDELLLHKDIERIVRAALNDSEIDAEAYHRPLADAFDQREKAAELPESDFDPEQGKEEGQ